MKLLALDTSGSDCSLALYIDGALQQVTEHVVRRHNELLLPMCEALFAGAGIAPVALDGVCFAAGPGSFTGVRLAASAAQAIAFAADVPVAPIPSSERLAAHAHVAGHTRVLTSVRSRAELYYVAAFDDARGCVHPDELLGEPPGWWEADMVVAGAMPPWLGEATAAPEDPSPAATLMGLALAGWERGVFVPAAQALPRYVQGDDPWRRR